ncbi:MAG: S41 family peptidase [Planctomycetota bacterium]|nr:S41 family peptidase [Planctomycetota bacterium]
MRSGFGRHVAIVLAAGILTSAAHAQESGANAGLDATNLGYYRQPTLHGTTVVFVAEGDLWRTTLEGGAATRLTSHPGDESTPQISPDGTLVAFTATYEGPTEVYVMPLEGGRPTRLTHDAARAAVVGWTRGEGGRAPRVIASTTRFSTLPNVQLTLIDPRTGSRERVPLWQASDGAYGPDGTLYFTRLPFQGSHTKRYKGGTAQNIWKFASTDAEATPLTPDFTGTSTTPMWFGGRVYFLSDRDGTMEVWSIRPDGSDPRQQTSHEGEGERLLDARGASIDASGASGRIVYQLGADLWTVDPATGVQQRLDITLRSDFDQTRDRWVKKPIEYLTSASIAPDGSAAALTARGQVFVVYKEGGRLVEAARREGVRYRDARFLADAGTLLTLSDESGEVELWTLPANGLGEAAQLTDDGVVLRWEGVPSPDGTKIAHHDKNQTLWIFDVATKVDTRIDQNAVDNFADLSWSADSRWLAYVASAANFNRQVKIHDTRDGSTREVTTDRWDTFDVTWSADGRWLYLLSDRNISTVVGSPWGPLQPEPYFDTRTEVYALSLRKGQRSPFEAWDELLAVEEASKKKDAPERTDEPGKPEQPGKTDETTPPAKPDEPAKPDGEAGKEGAGPPADGKKGAKKPEPVEIEFDGLAERLVRVPVPAGNYSNLSANDKRLFMQSRGPGRSEDVSLVFVEIARKDVEVKTLAPKVSLYELAADGKSLLVRSGDTLAIIEAGAAPGADLNKSKLRLDGWSFALSPREEWRQMFVEAWRLERDYFYDTQMHGVDWKAMLARYMPLVDRVATRAELSDLISQMVGELAALHIFVRGGDLRQGEDRVMPGMLGGLFERDDEAGGYRVAHVFESDPDEPDRRAPLARPGVDVRPGDVVTRVDGRPALEEPDLSVHLRGKVGRQVMLTVRGADERERRVIVTPISAGDEEDLRYHEWQYTRRRIVERESEGQFGYVHLRAMGAENMNEFAKGFYPVFRRSGLIIDVRHNRGGNIDSWLLSRLLRKAWFYWQPRVGDPYWNMQLAFRGHVVVLCNERTASDGEAFAEGVKRLDIGTVLGTRTWGGEIWLSSSNFLVDRGIATAAEYGVYGPEGEWLIEGHGVEPDIVVDNLPHATFKGEDAQLDRAIDLLRQKVREKPVAVPPAPDHPDKSFRGPGGNAPARAPGGSGSPR